MNQSAKAAILALGTAVPPYCNTQPAIAGWMSESLGRPPALSRWLNRLYEGSGIETRYTCLPDGQFPPSQSRLGPGRTRADSAATAERMAIYEREAVAVGVVAAGRALADYAERMGGDLASAAASVTHLIAVSCTGFFAPGLDLALTRRLGLRPTVERTLVGFMGCAAFFNALRLAHAIVRGDAQAHVLIVCVELCTLHIQPGTNRVDLVVSSLFADGAGAALVGAPTPGASDLFAIERLYTGVKPDTEEEMVWRVGDYGFTLHLSPQIPAHLSTVAPQALDIVLEGAPRPQFWAVHPGGRAIVDRLAEIFDLAPEQLAPTRDILRQYGNMSSPTILFVLEAWRRQLREAPGRAPVGGVAMAFGPGLVTEMAHLTYQP